MSEFFEVFINILGIIGIVALGAFLILLIVDLILFLVDGGRHGLIFRRRKCSETVEKTEIKEVKQVREHKVKNTDRPLVLDDNELDQDYLPHDEYTYSKSYDEELALNEQQALMASKSEKTVLVEEDALNIERNEVVEKRRREFEELDSLFDDEDEEEEDADEEEVKKQEAYIEEINEKSIAEYKAANKTETVVTAEIVEENVKASEEEVKTIETEIKEVEEEVKVATATVSTLDSAEREEIESAKAALEAERQKLEELRIQLIEEKTYLEEERTRLVRITETTDSDGDSGMRMGTSLTLDEINASLEKLRARLKVNEKELKSNKKEFLPLSRVKRTLENDKKKLRRREAIVAKQKVVLYGVNNYIDIDEEKAKKLSEELDLLDGLRLSVQHCEDVMTANKDRYPILENTNYILTEQNKQLKGDIAELEEKLALFEQNE